MTTATAADVSQAHATGMVGLPPSCFCLTCARYQITRAVEMQAGRLLVRLWCGHDRTADRLEWRTLSGLTDVIVTVQGATP